MSKRHYTTSPTPPVLNAAEVTALKQIRTLFEVFDKGLQAALTTRTAPVATTHDTPSNVPLLRRATDIRPPHAGAYVYRALDRKRVPTLSRGRKDVYETLTKLSKPVTVREAAVRSGHPAETTQQILVWLVKHNLAQRKRG